MKEEILIKFLNNDCSEEEIGLIREWLKNEDGKIEKEFERILMASWNAMASDEDITSERRRLLFTIHQKIKQNKGGGISGAFFNRWFDSGYLLKIAASVVIAISVAAFTLIYLTSGEEEQIVESDQKLKKLTTSPGQKKEALLPDGTRVFLNSASSIEYSEDFTEKVREVKLSGEAFFEVAFEPERPFRVITGHMETTVLGTKFNVKENAQAVKVTLAEGKVLVGLAGKAERITLEPGQMATSGSLDQEITIERVALADIIAWKNGVITFKDLSLKEVIEKLELWYGVNMEVHREIDLQRKISGEFNNENLKNILDGLSFSLEFDYVFSGKNVFIEKLDNEKI